MKRRKSETAEPKDLKSQTKTSWLYLLARQWRIENQILAPLLKFKITRLNDFAPIFNQSEAKSSNLIGSWFRLQFGERLRLMSVCWYVLKEKNISFLVDIEISKALFFFLIRHSFCVVIASKYRVTCSNFSQSDTSLHLQSLIVKATSDWPKFFARTQNHSVWFRH